MEGSKIPNVDEPNVEAELAPPSLANEHPNVETELAPPSLANEHPNVEAELAPPSLANEHPNVEAELAPPSLANEHPNVEAELAPPSLANEHDEPSEVLNIVDGLSNLNLGKEEIQLPTIVLVGDHGYGMSSVLESLARIGLPRGQGQSTRFPLVVKLQKSSNPVPDICLEYKGKLVPTDEDHIAEAIGTATDEIAGSGKGVSDTPLTLHVKKADVPDLTLVDLPGITRVPVDGQPKNISTKISKMIMKFIKPEESIILNVLPASVDFTTSESISMSKKVDKNGERTLAVVPKSDMSPEGLLQKLTADDVSIGVGYVCVRNRIGEETFEEARKEEEILFSTHPMLSVIDKDIVGIPALANKLKQIQEAMISRQAAKPPQYKSTRLRIPSRRYSPDSYILT
ncbi:hypothetical protein CARUB_v10021653mg [Capsella rubella]|uniref:Dynamin-type G domain-containing protein n=1 Tax=Capsella rubella TaxID=81985 RepID=R0GET3_9BRAS|nr:putative dynamin-related protein 4A [Capsella rubella]EOA34151.1 hypothetical protein CARUB_v10021653mg [Capsella rubella]